MRFSLSAFLLLCMILATPGLSFARNVTTINLEAGFSVPLQLPEAATTIAIGNQGIIATNTLKPDLLMINGQATGATSMTVFGRSGSIYEYRVQVGNDVQQLRSMIKLIEKNVSVEDLNGIIVLKGIVQTPTGLVRVLTIADRYVSGATVAPDFSVISDRGGVLSGNLNETQGGIDEELVGVSPDPRIAIPTVNFGGANLRGGGGAGGSGGNSGGSGGSGGGSNRNGSGNGNGGVAAALRQPLMPIKGNLAQNISRGEVVMVGGGKVMSLIKVAKQPKVEIQMQVIAVDRNKTDEYGIDWRLDGTVGNKQITVGSLLGNVSRTSTSTAGGSAPGSSTLFGFLQSPGRYTLSTFLKFLEQKGAAKTLSSPLVTAISGESASFLVGGNVPIPTQTIVTSNTVVANAAVATNVTFIQFGLKLIVRPTVLENDKISIVLDQSISEPDYSQAITLLGAQIPGFNQRSVSTVTESASGESWAVAGLLSEENSKNLDQVPWLSKVPVIGVLFKNKSQIRSRNELMILVNARVIEGDNNTSINFDGKGDLAPDSTQGDSEKDLPLPEEPLSVMPGLSTAPVNPVTKEKASSTPRPPKLQGNMSRTDVYRLPQSGVLPDGNSDNILPSPLAAKQAGVGNIVYLGTVPSSVEIQPEVIMPSQPISSLSIRKATAVRSLSVDSPTVKEPVADGASHDEGPEKLQQVLHAQAEGQVPAFSLIQPMSSVHPLVTSQ